MWASTEIEDLGLLLLLLLRSLRSKGTPPSSTMIFLFQSLSLAREASSWARSVRSFGLPMWTIAVWAQTHDRIALLLTIEGRERLVPLLELKIESSHFMSKYTTVLTFSNQGEVSIEILRHFSLVVRLSSCWRESNCGSKHLRESVNLFC